MIKGLQVLMARMVRHVVTITRYKFDKRLSKVLDHEVVFVIHCQLPAKTILNELTLIHNVFIGNRFHRRHST